MKILICNAFYYARGGAEVCALDLESLLMSQGHEVIFFSMEHPQNLPSPYSSYFVSYINYPELLENVNLKNIIRATERIVFSREDRNKLTQLIKDTKPDIAHLHNIGHELSPSILYVLSKANIPIVLTLHDFGHICPNTTFFSNSEVCERCKGGKFYQAVLRRCKRNSLPASMLASLGAYTHHWLKTYPSKVDTFIAPSAFLRQKMIEFGYPPDKIVHLPNTIKLEDFQPSYRAGKYILFFGRLVHYKGIFTLLMAMAHFPYTPLIIAGEGELENDLKGYVQKKGLAKVEFVGYQLGEALHDLIRKSAFVVVPSECYENAPLACIEAMALGRPVIGANIGGIPELVEDGETGFLFESRNFEDLAEKIDYLLVRPGMQIKMGRNARSRIEEVFNSDRYYHSVMEIYQRFIRGSKKD
jgi:glycosyltransferase involved in cell wall biosynthesis